MKVVDRPSGLAEVHGEVLVELFERGRKVDESRSENYISPLGLAHNKWSVRSDFMRGHIPSETFWQSTNTDTEPLNPLTHLACFSDTSAEDTSSSTLLGSISAWSNRLPYSGSSSIQGTPNVAECEAQPDHAKWVFDWPTNAGNGTFQSVGWTNLNESMNALPYGRGQVIRNAILSPLGLTSYQYCGSYDAVNDLIVTAGYDPSSGINRTVTMPRTSLLAGTTTGRATPFVNSSFVTIVKVDAAGNYWTDSTSGGSGNFLQKRNAAGAVLASYLRPYPDSVSQSVYDWCWDPANDGTLWYADGTAVVKKVHYSSPTVLATVTFPIGISVVGFFGNDLMGTSKYGNGYYPLWAYSTSGVLKWTSSPQTGGGQLQTVFGIPGGYLCDQDIFQAYTGVSLPYGALGTRSRLAAAVTKTNLQTMKITYRFNFN